MNENTRYNVNGIMTRPRRIESISEQEVRDELHKLNNQKNTIVGQWREDFFDTTYFHWFMDAGTVKLERDTTVTDHATGVTVYWIDVDVVKISDNAVYLCPDHGYDTNCVECTKKYVGEPQGVYEVKTANFKATFDFEKDEIRGACNIHGSFTRQPIIDPHSVKDLCPTCEYACVCGTDNCMIHGTYVDDIF